MTKFRTRYVALVLSVAAVVVAGCGSSSSSKSTPAAASTPATPSTPSTGTATAFAPSKLPLSTSLSSPQVKAGIISLAEKNGAPANKASAWTDCFVSKLEAEGIKTGGDFKANQAKAGAAVDSCNKQVGVTVKP